jgi:hypothetical protein
MLVIEGSSPVPRDDLSRERERTAEHPSGALDASFLDEATDGGRGDDLAADLDLRDPHHVEAHLGADAAEEVRVPGAIVTEAEVHADVDLRRGDPALEERLEELLGGHRR